MWLVKMTINGYLNKYFKFENVEDAAQLARTMMLNHVEDPEREFDVVIKHAEGDVDDE